ncbi:pleiotropic drug resistance protein 3-like [Gossypium australe]|uniref:Pleiotropic drug resistance protein 3-like n=1 Tax=Gossypium australe TaxID=47621 RepID=A0A5B6WNY0_9ROSI|nr:pleiotropic drug resistance protein 3-like [Gossypium australe]
MQSLQKTGHSEKFIWFRPGVQCRNCKQFGHIEKVCKNREQQQQHTTANENQVQEELAFITSSFTVNNQMRKNWLIDSSFTNHIVSNESMFKRIDKSFSLRIRFGNDQIIKAKGKRDVQVSTPTGTKVITNVLFVPDIDQNLLSVGQLIEKNYSVIFESRKCIISESHDHELISTDDSDLWHKKLGHANYRSLDMLYKHGLVENMSKFSEQNEVCEVCQYEKQARLPFPVNKA